MLISASFTAPSQLAAAPYIPSIGATGAGGVSSFAYNGTIAHTVLRRTSDPADGEQLPIPMPLRYKERSFKWRDLPHPFAQRHAPSVDGVDIFRSSASVLRTLVADHVVQGRIIFPGAGYLEMARAVATAGTALRAVFFLQPLAIETPGLLVECVVRDGGFEARSGIDEDGFLVETAMHCSGSLALSDGWQRTDLVSTRARLCAHAEDTGALYDGFHAIGLQYGPGYRTLAQAWSGAADALAQLQVRTMQQGTQVHPGDLDDAQCASVLASRMDGETRLPFAVDDAKLECTPGQLWAVRRITTALSALPPQPPHASTCPRDSMLVPRARKWLIL